MELEVRSIGASGAAFINGVEVGGWGTKAFVVDQVMAPVCRLLQATDIFAQAKTLCYEAGPLEMRQEGTLLSLAGATS